MTVLVIVLAIAAFGLVLFDLRRGSRRSAKETPGRPPPGRGRGARSSPGTAKTNKTLTSKNTRGTPRKRKG